MRRLALASLAALVLAAPVAAGPPAAGTLVPGRSLGGIELGDSKAEVERRWGRAYGICRSCARTTWYFNSFAFQPRGAGVELGGGRVAAVFTLHSPPGWRTGHGLTLGDPASSITAIHGPLERRACDGYHALVIRRPRAVTAFYVLDDRLWAFGLSRPGVPLCRP